MWRDHYENRHGYGGRPLGGYATALFIKLFSRKDEVLFSEFVVKELLKKYDRNSVNNMFGILSMASILKRVEIREKDTFEARNISYRRNLPVNDVLHAILARNNNAILVSQDKHFQLLKDIANVKRPDEI